MRIEESENIIENNMLKQRMHQDDEINFMHSLKHGEP